MSNFLQEMRKEIDVVDQQIMAALVRRFKITHKVGVYKKSIVYRLWIKKEKARSLRIKKSWQ